MTDLMKEDEAVKVDADPHGQLISQIVAVCRNLKNSGEDLLLDYFKLGRLADILHNEGFTYREMEDALRNKEPSDWIPKHTTIFSAHKFYLAVKSYFNSDVEDFLKKNPDITWRGLSRRVLSEHKLTECSTVERDKIYTSCTISRHLRKNLVSRRSYRMAKMRLRAGRLMWLVGFLRRWPC